MPDHSEVPDRALDEARRLRERLQAIEAREREFDQLRREATLFRELVDQSLGFMCVHDLDGTLRLVNRAAAEALGFRPDEGVGRSLREFLVPEARSQFDAYLERIRASPVDPGLMRVLARDGREQIWLYRNVRQETPGHPPRVLGHAHDVTDRVRAEQALRESERRFRLLADTAPVLIWMCDETGARTFLNRPWLDFTGRSLADSLGEAGWEAVYPADRPRVRRALAEALAARRPLEVEYRLRRVDGEYRWILDRGVPRAAADAGRVGMIGACADVTDARGAREVIERAHDELIRLVAQKTAELEQVNDSLRDEMHRRIRTERHLARTRHLEALGLLAGEVAHAFNNLLTIISGRSQLVLERMDPAPAVRQQVTLIEGTAQRASRLSRQLLAFSRCQLIVPRPADLNTLVADALARLLPLAGNRVEVRLGLDPDLPPVLLGASQIERVLGELIENGRLAMPDGGELAVETARVDLDESFVAVHPGARSGPHARLRIRDTGVGMDEATRARIFEPFFTANPRGVSVGLGLAAVYGIVKQHRGYIDVSSVPGRGTTVDVYVPLAPGVPALARGAELSPAAAIDPGTVLLVDDEDEVRSMACDILEEEGFSVLPAQHPVEALAIGRGHAGPIDVLVTDVVLPEMSGRELADRLRHIRPGLRVVYISGHGADTIARYGMRDPGVVFIPKPLTIDSFVGRVRAVLQG
ncbi:MAG TPA: PAS domain S-box protein [Candidatus Limnocylindrales bacterium]|nr:PAS domain S-box protein [Candidatus Limnocylindrales bacterium]